MFVPILGTNSIPILGTNTLSTSWRVFLMIVPVHSDLGNDRVRVYA
jgi:hypothetical protein